MNYLIIGHNPYSTSTFSRITKHVIDFLSKDTYNNLYVLSLGETIARSYENVIISPVYNFEKQLEHSIKYSNPDIIITICDLMDNFPLYYHKLNPVSHSWKWIGIFDIQTMPPPPSFINIVLEMDHILTYSTGIYNFLSPNSDINVQYGPLGVDSNLFYPLSNQKEIYKSLFDNNTFTLLSPGSNSEDNYKIALVEAFAIFSRKKDDVYLYFCDRDGSNYYEIENLSWKFPWIVDKIMMKTDPDFQILENHDLNNLYNSVTGVVDVSIKSNFSLSCLEALSCGCNVLIAENPLNPPKQYLSYNKIKTIPTNKVINAVGGENRYVIIEELVKKIDELYVEYKSGNLDKTYMNEDVLKEFSWNEFDASLKYILNNMLNIKDKGPEPTIL